MRIRVFLIAFLAAFMFTSARASGIISISLQQPKDITVNWLKADTIAVLFASHEGPLEQKVVVGDSVKLPAILSIRAGNKSADFVITENELPGFRIVDTGDSIYFPGSAENEAFSAFESTFNPRDDSLAFYLRFESSEIDKDYLAQLTANDANLGRLIIETNRTYENIIRKYANSYAAAMCKMLLLPYRPKGDKKYDNNRAYLFDHYFDNISAAKIPADGPYFTFYLKRYFNFVTPRRKDALRQAVEICYKASGADSFVSDKIFDFLMRNYERNHELSMIKYTRQVFGKTGKPETAAPKQPVPLNGDIQSTAANLNLPDAGNEMVSLAEVARHSRQTVLIFWSADCEHCLQQLPLYYEHSDKFVLSGISTYAVAINSDIPTCREVIKHYPAQSYQVFSGKPEELVSNFMIKSTPLFLVLNPEMKIVARFDSVADLLSSVTQK